MVDLKNKPTYWARWEKQDFWLQLYATNSEFMRTDLVVDKARIKSIRRISEGMYVLFFYRYEVGTLASDATYAPVALADLLEEAYNYLILEKELLG